VKPDMIPVHKRLGKTAGRTDCGKYSSISAKVNKPAGQSAFHMSYHAEACLPCWPAGRGEGTWY
jgi:hypothetical protein